LKTDKLFTVAVHQQKELKFEINLAKDCPASYLLAFLLFTDNRRSLKKGPERNPFKKISRHQKPFSKESV
jgi:hypothetical protein